jgi:CRISPR-associated endonuclease/helicase Cas3
MSTYASASRTLRSAAIDPAHSRAEDWENPGCGRVDHSSAVALETRAYGPLGEPLAFVIAGHHVGFVDREKLLAWMDRKKQRRADPLAHEPAQSVPETQVLSQPFETKPGSAAEGSRIRRRYERWIRMLFLALGDADFFDTEAFFEPEQSQVPNEAQRAVLSTLLERLRSDLDGKQARAPATALNAVRREVRAPMGAAASPPDVFTRTVSTGGGKTRTTMEFALQPACTHALHRVVVAIPYKSSSSRMLACIDAVLAHEMAHSAFR